jgi:predicted nucleotidyltransferase component of viral defense system
MDKANWKTAVYNEKKIRKSETLQLILLDNLYAQSGSQDIIFQGGTALRWVYGGMRFSEDLDFVTSLPAENIDKILTKTLKKMESGCIAQFGPGISEQKIKSRRKSSTQVLFIYRPDGQRERIAVKLEFEKLKTGHQPEFEKFVLKDLPSVTRIITSGELVLPYTSSIILVETPEEILSDKIRALYERQYIKGRDIYDVWWLTKKLEISPQWALTHNKFGMYQAPFVAAREADFFQKKKNVPTITAAIESDLTRFIPQNIYALHRGVNFGEFLNTLKEVTSGLLNQGMRSFLKDHERRKSDT